MIVWTRAHRNKPPHRPVLDRAHPLAQGLLGAWVVTEGSLRALNDLVHGPMHQATLHAGTPALTADRRGLAMRDGHYRVADGRLFRRGDRTGVSIVMRCLAPTSGPAVRSFIYDVVGGSNGWSIYSEFSNTRLTWEFRHDTGFTIWRPGETNNYPRDVWFDFAATSGQWLASGSRQTRMWWRGGAQARLDGVNFIGPLAGQTLGIGEPNGGVWISYVYYWDRGLADREVEWVWEEPWAFLRTGVFRRVFAVPSGVPLRFTAPAAVEWQTGRRAHVDLRPEWRGPAGVGAAVPLEWLAEQRLARSGVPVAVEWRRGVERRVTLLPAEWSGTIPIGAGIGLAAEWRRGLRTAAATGGAFSGWPVEWTARLVTASGTAGWPVEVLRRVRVPFGAPVPGTGGLPVEWLGATALGAGAPLPTEWLAKRRAGLALPAEWRGTAALGVGQPLPTEWTARGQRPGRLETEWRGQDPFRLLHRRTVLRRLRVPLPHQRQIVESRFRATLAHQRTVRRPLPRLVHSRRILPQGLVAGFGEDVQRVVREADRTP